MIFLAKKKYDINLLTSFNLLDFDGDILGVCLHTASIIQTYIRRKYDVDVYIHAYVITHIHTCNKYKRTRIMQ